MSLGKRIGTSLRSAKEAAKSQSSKTKSRIQAAAKTDEWKAKMKKLSSRVGNMSETAWQKMMESIAKAAGWAYGKRRGALADMKKETFFRKTRAYLGRLDPAGKAGLIAALLLIAGSAVAAAATGGLLSLGMAVISGTYMATAQGRAYVNYLATPEPGYIYVMYATMPDGKIDIKAGQTTRTPEIRAAELSAQRGGNYEVVAEKWVPDVDHAEGDILGLFREHLGDPDVGREQWDLDPDIDPVPFMEAMAGGPVHTADDENGPDSSADAPEDSAV